MKQSFKKVYLVWYCPFGCERILSHVYLTFSGAYHLVSSSKCPNDYIIEITTASNF